MKKPQILLIHSRRVPCQMTRLFLDRGGEVKGEAYFASPDHLDFSDVPSRLRFGVGTDEESSFDAARARLISL